jgi:hypothetical protein
MILISKFHGIHDHNLLSHDSGSLHLTAVRSGWSVKLLLAFTSTAIPDFNLFKIHDHATEIELMIVRLLSTQEETNAKADVYPKDGVLSRIGAGLVRKDGGSGKSRPKIYKSSN